MAVKVQQTRICDRCGSEVDVDHYHVNKNNGKRRFSFDACSECAESAPIEEWERLRGAGSGRRLVRQVVDPSVIEKAARRNGRRVRKG